MLESIRHESPSLNEAIDGSAFNSSARYVTRIGGREVLHFHWPVRAMTWNLERIIW